MDVDGSTVPMTMTDYLIDSAWNIDTLMAVISSRQLPDDFKYDEYIDNSKCTVDILAFEETKPSIEAMDLDEDENKKKRSRGNNNDNKDEDSQKMSVDDEDGGCKRMMKTTEDGGCKRRRGTQMKMEIMVTKKKKKVTMKMVAS